MNDTVTTIAEGAGEASGGSSGDTGADVNVNNIDSGAGGGSDNATDNTGALDSGADSFGDDWREKLAGGDEKLKKRLDRYKTPTDFAKAFDEAQKKISSGELKSKLPDNATKEQLAEWRAENGIPETPDGYELSLDGIAIGDADKPLVDEFLKSMHGLNASSELVSAAVKTYFDIQQKQIDAISVGDSEFQAESQEALREAWGKDYKVKMNTLHNFANSLPDDIKGDFLGARLANGKLLGDSPAVIQWMSDLASKINPSATNTPNNATGNLNNAHARMREIESKMGTSDYYAKGLDKEYNSLLIQFGEPK